MLRNIRFVPFLLLLTGCLAQSQVQGKYDSAREDCQSTAEDAVNNTVPMPKSRASALKTEFARCMRKEGWKLTTAKPAPAPAPIDASRSTGTLKQAPASSGPYAQPSQQPANVPPQQTTQQLLPTQQANPASVTAATPVVPQGASTYQPATATDAAASGAAPGRYFGPR